MLLLQEPSWRTFWAASFLPRTFSHALHFGVDGGYGRAFLFVAEQGCPAQLRAGAVVAAGALDCHVCDVVDNPLEVFFADGDTVRVGRGVHEVDGVGDAVFDRELDRVEVVAEGLAQGQGVALHALDERRVIAGRVLDVALRVRPRGVVRHDAHVLLVDDVATEILAELDRRLEHHALAAALVIGVEELVRVVDVGDVAPAAAVMRLEEGREADVVKDAMPVVGDTAGCERRCRWCRGAFLCGAR